MLSQPVLFIDYAINNGSIVYLVRENMSNAPYYFLFAAKLRFKQANQAPIISNIPDLYATVGGLFTYEVQAYDPDGDNITFELVLPLFEIKESTGIINFIVNEENYIVNLTLVEAPIGMTIKDNVIKWTPKLEGNYTVRVRATDGNIYTDSFFIIEVQP